MNLKKIAILTFILSTTLFAGACSSQLERGNEAPKSGGEPKNNGDAVMKATPVIDITKGTSLDRLIPAIASNRVIYVGETHDAYGHHLNQLAVIKALHQRNSDIAIGMEFFQQPFQQVLDDYIAGTIDEKSMLRQSEWYTRWRFDFRLYQPLLQYARAHKIPVIALNVAKELTERVSAVGIAALEPSERAMLPQQIDDSDERYKERIRNVYEHHPGTNPEGFQRFLQVQLTWDEGMADRAASYLMENPERQIVVLAGSGHLMFGDGIPNRVSRRLPIESAILLPGDNLKIEPGIADYLIYPKPVELPQAGLMGVLLEDHEKGVRISGVVPDSAAVAVGIEKGDIIQQLDGQPVKDFIDIKLGMLGKLPGEPVTLKLLRPRMVLGDQLLEKRFELGR